MTAQACDQGKRASLMIYDIFEGTEQMQQAIIGRAISGGAAGDLLR